MRYFLFFFLFFLRKSFSFRTPLFAVLVMGILPSLQAQTKSCDVYREQYKLDFSELPDVAQVRKLSTKKIQQYKVLFFSFSESKEQAIEEAKLRIAESIVNETSLGPDPDSKLQVIGIDDFIRITAGAVDHLENPPAVINCCHPRIWTMREMSKALHSRLGKGRVIFDRESGGIENSYYADPNRMIKLFGEPTVKIELILDAVCEDILAS